MRSVRHYSMPQSGVDFAVCMVLRTSFHLPRHNSMNKMPWTCKLFYRLRCVYVATWQMTAAVQSLAFLLCITAVEDTFGLVAIRWSRR